MDSEMKEQVHLVELSATTLMGITNDLLDYSKLESGNLQLERACFEFPGFIEGCVTSVRHDAEEKRLHISSSVAKDTPLQILGDPNRLRRILYNLLENAIKFTQASGQVCLTVSVADERLRFEISDTGTGVTVADQATIFEKYRVGHASAARNYVGTGLGLAICRGLVEAMGGMIGLRSEIGKGSTFYFEIPLQLPSKESLSSEEASDPVFDEEKPLKILVAEDNKINQKVVRAMLQRIGHSVTIAENGQVAVDELKQKRFDLVLMDRMMPIMDGIQATLAIRSMGLSKSELPIVGLTASFQHSELQFYLENGMNDCLGKPVKLASLKRVIAQAMRNAGTQSPMSSG
jgi:CheY-like chemotaxis protein